MLLAESLLGTSSTAANYIEDVFSTYLYTGNSTSLGTQTITNNIDLSTKGGMVWIKGRSAAANHYVADTVRGAGTSGQSNNGLFTNTQDAENGVSGTDYDFISAFGSTGFTVRQYGGTTAERCTNYNGVTYSSWAFRKQAKFFDIVTYTGTGSARTISHSLGSVPGAIFIKARSETGDWTVYHRSVGNASYLALNNTNASAATTAFNTTTPGSTVFSIGANNTVNRSGTTYVAYLFAHDAGGFGASGSDNVISCGSYTGTGAAGNFVSLGYEPQWLLIKRSDASQDWFLFDNMRGLVTGTGGDLYLNPNLSGAEGASGTYVAANATGFTLEGVTTGFNASGGTYIYIAIRRGPMKTPTSGTSVFTPVVYSGTGLSGLQVTTNIVTDMVIGQKLTGTEVYQHNWTDRLRGPLSMIRSPSSDAQLTTADWIQSFALMNGVTLYNDASVNESGTNNHVMYGFRRAPGFFDVVCYTGTAISGSGGGFSHNLGVVPELIIIKNRGGAYNWKVKLASVLGRNDMELNNTGAAPTVSSTYWDNLTDTSTKFYTRADNFEVDAVGSKYVAYLFATCPGVSKVGSYTGSGTTKQINCGFTSGARFVLIKRTDSTGDWYVWDTARGIVAGNDPYLLLNTTAGQVTNTDYIDTYSAGFEISSTAPAAINANGGSYIFMAVS